ncbi:MAG: hypothetical protein HQ515_15750 [Phycisphaeraceae bacterium]|nr:hypothetical protein [Phycisphaeraceae bacterium]
MRQKHDERAFATDKDGNQVDLSTELERHYSQFRELPASTFVCVLHRMRAPDDLEIGQIVRMPSLKSTDVEITTCDRTWLCPMHVVFPIENPVNAKSPSHGLSNDEGSPRNLYAKRGFDMAYVLRKHCFLVLNTLMSSA